MTTRASMIVIMATAAIAGVVWVLLPDPAASVPPSAAAAVAAATNRIDSASICPWRDPARDVGEWFPGCTGSRSELRLVGSRSTELAKRLGRQPDAEEKTLVVHRIAGPAGIPGAVLVRRVRGSAGDIEIAVGVDNGGAVRGLRIQQMSEPEAIATVLRSDVWLGAFRSRRVDDSWTVGEAWAPVPAEARRTAQAIADGVRSLLVLLETSNASPVPVVPLPDVAFGPVVAGRTP